MITRLLGYVAGVCAAAAPVLQPEDASLAGLQPGGVLTRRACTKKDLFKLGEEATRFKESRGAWALLENRLPQSQVW